MARNDHANPAMPVQVPIIDAARCSGCGRCIAACHLNLFAFEREGWRKISVLQDSERCSGCGKCAVQCPIDALRMRAHAPIHPILPSLFFEPQPFEGAA